MQSECEQVQELMADALGGELAPSDREALDRHLAQCVRCRDEYESGQRAIGWLRELPAPAGVTVARRDDSLVLSLAPASSRWVGAWAPLLRYAAVVVIAFLAGMMSGGRVPDSGDVQPIPGRLADAGFPVTSAQPSSLQEALVQAHRRNPGKSDLAKCLIALGASTH